MPNHMIVETDNHGRDYPDESFVNVPPMTKEACQKIADVINEEAGERSHRFWKVVEMGYKPAPGFEP